MKNKEVDAILKQLMLEQREHIFNGVVPSSAEKFMEDARADRRAAIHYEAAHREYKSRRQRALAFVVAACLVIAVTFSVSPEARAFVQRIGMRLASYIAPKPEKFEIGLIAPNISLVNRIEDTDSGFIQTEYLYESLVKITITQRPAFGNDLTVPNQKGTIGTLSILGEQLDYYLDNDGIIGRLEFMEKLILISADTISTDLFESIVNCIQVVN